jgi:DNA polymerase III epsilon subunit-like protein
MPYNIVLDFETTGVNPLTCMPVQVACCAYDQNGKELEEITFLIQPTIAVELGAFNVHGLSNEILNQKGKSLRYFADFWHKLIWKYQPCNILGYNIINFDYIILQRVLGEYKEGRFKYPPVEKIIDVMFLAQRFFRTTKWPKLREAVNRLGIPHDPSAFHDALYDVRSTWKVYEKLVITERKSNAC